MSYPRLVLKGEDSYRVLNEIYLAFDNSNPDTDQLHMQRLKYDVYRDTRNSGVASGTPKRYPNVNYDQYRFIHKWVGFLDVLTESVSLTGSPTPIEEETVFLIKNALIFYDQAYGIQHSIKSFDTTELGPGKPSTGGTWLYAVEKGPFAGWAYKEDATKLYNTKSWLIRDIQVSDNGNNTSRVTFSFEAVTSWLNIEDAIPEGSKT